MSTCSIRMCILIISLRINMNPGILPTISSWITIMIYTNANNNLAPYYYWSKLAPEVEYKVNSVLSVIYWRYFVILFLITVTNCCFLFHILGVCDQKMFFISGYQVQVHKYYLFQSRRSNLLRFQRCEIHFFFNFRVLWLYVTARWIRWTIHFVMSMSHRLEDVSVLIRLRK